MSSRTLWCENGKHNFEHPGGRGRPPKNCSEHKVVKVVEKSKTPEVKEAAKENPFIKKATGNPFIDKAKPADDWDEQEAMIGEQLAKEVVKSNARRPFKKPEFDEVVDNETHHSADLAGVKISNLRRDSTGVWTCNLTVGDETFNLVRRGGWQIHLEDGSMRFAKPNVAAVIQAFVYKLEKPTARDKKTFEDVADEVVPLPENHEDKVDKPKRGRRTKIEEPSKTCDCCDRKQEPDENGWVVDPDEGVDLCPECAEALEVEASTAGTMFDAVIQEKLTDDLDKAAELLDEGSEHPINDLLSNPAQYDDEFDEMADAFSALDFELGDS